MDRLDKQFQFNYGQATEVVDRTPALLTSMAQHALSGERRIRPLGSGMETSRPSVIFSLPPGALSAGTDNKVLIGAGFHMEFEKGRRCADAHLGVGDTAEHQRVALCDSYLKTDGRGVSDTSRAIRLIADEGVVAFDGVRLPAGRTKKSVAVAVGVIFSRYESDENIADAVGVSIA